MNNTIEDNDNIYSEENRNKLNKFENTNYIDIYLPKNLCDIRVEGKWTVGVIKELKENNLIEVNDYLLSNQNLHVNGFNNDEISYLRKNTKPNEKKRKCSRNNTKTIININNYFSRFIEFNFGKNLNSSFNEFMPYDYINILRGKLFYLSDEILCSSRINNGIGIDLSLKFIEILLNIIKLFYDFGKENNGSVLLLQNLYNSNYDDYILIDKKLAIISFLSDSFLLLKRLFGHSEYYNDFFTEYENDIRIILEQKDNILSKNIENICLSSAYKKKTYLIHEDSKYKIPTRIICFSIDYFYSINGFDSLTKLLISNDEFPFNYLKIFTEPFVQIKSIVGTFNQNLNQNILEIWEYFDRKIINFNDEDLRKVKDKEIYLILKRLFDFCSLDDIEKQNKFENSYLLYLNKCFNCKILELQINSMKSYSSITLAIKYNNSKVPINDRNIRNQKDSFIKNLSGIEFTNYLREKDVINKILEADIHEEIIKQSYNIILISYENNFGETDKEIIKTTSQNIFQKLYQKLINARNNNEYLEKIILDLFVKFAPSLIDEDKFIIFNYLKQYIEFREINQELIELIERYTVQCLLKNNENNDININENNLNIINDNFTVSDFDEEKFYGLKMIWNLMQSEQENFFNDKNKYSSIIDQCIKSLKAILFIPNLNNSVRELILIKSFDNIKSNKGSIQHIILIKDLVEKGHLFKKFNLILEKLNIDFNLFTIIINNLLKYYDSVSSIIDSENLSENDINEMKNITYIGIFTHEISIKIHIDLLIVLMSKERTLNWEFEVFLNLWNKILKDKFSQKIIFSTLAKEISNIKQNFRDQIFNNIICNNELFKIDKIENFQLYKTMIFGININNDNFFMFNKNDFRINVDNLNLIVGYNKLWEILLTNENYDIQNECSEILYKICLGYKYPKKSEAINYYNSFISTLINNLNKSIGNEENEKNEIGIKGILILVKKIFDNINSSSIIIQDKKQIPDIKKKKKKKKEEKKEEEEKKNDEEKKEENEEEENKKNDDEQNEKINNEKNKKNDNVYIEFQYKGTNGNYCCKYNYPFYYVRFTISYFFHIPLNNISFIYETTENKKSVLRQFDLCDDFDLFIEKVFKNEKLKSNKQYIIQIKNTHNPLIDLENNPQKLLTNDESFQKNLTNLLRDKNKSYLNEVWLLLKEKMEKNKHIKNQIKSIVNEENKNESEINTTFDFLNTSVYYVSYIISNINEILQEEKKNKNDKFIEDFIKCKIYEKLNEMLNNFSINEYITSDRTFAEKMEIMKTLINLINIYEIICEIEKEENNNLIICRMIQFIKEIFDSNIGEDSLNTNLYEKKVESMDKIINLITNNNNLLNNFISNILSDENIKEIFFYLLNNGLIKSKNKEIKKKYKNFILGIFNIKLYSDEEKLNKFKEINTFMLNYFFQDENLENNINLSKENEYEFELYFQVINKIIESSIKLNLDFNYENLLKEKLLSPIINDENFPEQIISGYFLLILTIIIELKIPIENLNNENFNLANFIFYDCLFSKCIGDSLKKKPPKITSKSGFKHSSNLFNYLIKQNKESIDSYYNILNNFHYDSFWRSNNYDHWNINIKSNLKKDYVGLKNLGCICYLNSLLQIFFSIIPFRESILNSYCKNEEKNVLYQLKYLFSSLKYYDTEYFIPYDFTQNFDNEKLNIKEQMDMDEFFSLLLDKLENRLKGTNNENIIKHFFEIKTSDDLIFQKGCNHHRSKEVSLLSVQLQVKGKKNIKESLDTFIEGELMDQDNCIYCEHCNKKFPAMKSQSFKKLPRILIFVLKRFEFNYETMQKIKINDEYQFPLELDMTDYLYENIHNNNNNNNDNINNINNMNNYNINSNNLYNNNMNNNINNINQNINDNNEDNFQLINNENEDKNLENIKNQMIENTNITDINTTNESENININDINTSNNQNLNNSNNKNLNNENSNKKNNKYKLKAIAIHSGGSEGGHYYAFIRVGKFNDNNWYQFNDTKVTKFNIEDLPKEAFGGYDKYIDPETKRESSFPCTRNAYLVFYEKENEDNCENYDKVILNNENDINGIYNSPFYDKINRSMYQNNIMKVIFNENYHKFILEFLVNYFNQFYKENEFEKLFNFSSRTNMKDIDGDNKNKLFGCTLNKYIKKGKIKIFYNNNYIFRKENDKIDENKYLEIFQFLIIYFFNVFIRTKEKSCIGGTIELIKFCMNNVNICAKFLIEEFTNENIIKEYIVNCPFIEIKKVIIGILFCAMFNVDILYKPEINKLKEEREKKEIERKKKYEIYLKEEKERKLKEKSNKKDKKDKKENKIEDNMVDDFVLLEKPIEEEENENKNYIIDGIDIRNPIKEVYDFSPLLSDLIKNILKILEMVELNKKASNFLFYILYRFSSISDSTRNYLVKRIIFLQFLNTKYFDQSNNKKLPFNVDWKCSIPEHSILSNIENNIVSFEFNFISQIEENYLVLFILELNISHVTLSDFYKYCDAKFSFKKKDYIEFLFKAINTLQDANELSKVINKICYLNEEYTLNVNEVFKSILNSVVYQNYFYLFLILKKYLIDLNDNESMRDIRMNKLLRRLFKVINNNKENISFVNEISTFLLNLFVNFHDIMDKYFSPNLQKFKDLLILLNQNMEFFKDKLEIILNLINSKI